MNLPDSSITVVILVGIIGAISALAGALIVYVRLGKEQRRLTEDIENAQAEYQQVQRELMLHQDRMQRELEEYYRLQEQHQSLENNHIRLTQERDSTREQLHKIAATHTQAQQSLESVRIELSQEKQYRKQRDKEIERQMQALEQAREHFRSEEERMKSAALHEQQQREIQLTRLWNEHEQLIQQRIRDLCKRSEIRFTAYDNTNLPPSIASAGIKPDILVELLPGQYTVFDMKKSKNVRTYIQDQVKKTAQKYESIPEIWRTVYFVLPMENLQEIETRIYEVGSFRFVCIDEGAIDGVLMTLRRISEYAKLEELSPEDRESIVTIMAEYERQIELSGALGVLLAERGQGAVEQSRRMLHNEIEEELQRKKESIGPAPVPNRNEVHRLSTDEHEMHRRSAQLLQPQVMIPKQQQQAVKQSLL